jgi:hypothetical protein
MALAVARPSLFPQQLAMQAAKKASSGPAGVSARARALKCSCPGRKTWLLTACQCHIYVQAQFYSWAAFGQPLAESLQGGGPRSLGSPRRADLTASIQVACLQ